MSAADYPCAMYGCDERATSVYCAVTGAIYGGCDDHQVTLLPGEHWVWPPSKVEHGD